MHAIAVIMVEWERKRKRYENNFSTKSVKPVGAYKKRRCEKKTGKNNDSNGNDVCDLDVCRFEKNWEFHSIRIENAIR